MGRGEGRGEGKGEGGGGRGEGGGGKVWKGEKEGWRKLEVVMYFPIFFIGFPSLLFNIYNFLNILYIYMHIYT